MSWPDHYWSENEIKRLKELWMEGLTTRVIGQHLGVSKNSVVGKIRRLGMSNSRPYYPPGSRTAHVPLAPVLELEPEPPPQKKLRKPLEVRLHRRKVERQKPDPPIGSFGIMNLRHGVCKWPENDSAPWLFCGARALEAMPYCEAHTRRARQGPQHRARPIESYAIKRLARGA
jgi:GcrA cell cycle regulator